MAGNNTTYIKEFKNFEYLWTHKSMPVGTLKPDNQKEFTQFG